MEKACSVRVCRHVWLRETCMCVSHIRVDRGVSVEVHVTVCRPVRVHRRGDPGVWDCLRVCSIIPAPLALARLPSPPAPGPPQARSTSMPPSCMRLAALSISVCLTKRKLRCPGGAMYLVPPPLPTMLCYSHGGVPLPPLPQYAVSPGASSLRL